MFALYFNTLNGRREFIGTLESPQHAEEMAKLISKSDARQVVVVENRIVGDTLITGVYSGGKAAQAPTDAMPIPPADQPASQPGVPT